MLTWNECSSSRPRGKRSKSGIDVNLVVPFDLHMVVDYIGRTLEPMYTAVGCVYAWSLNWAKQALQHRTPISQGHKANKAAHRECPLHFFSAQKLNMRNAP